MPVLQILALCFFMIFVPVAMGAGVSVFVDKADRNIFFMWITGCLLMFASFQIIAIPMILKMCTLTALVWCFGIVCVAGAAAGLGIRIWKRKPVLRVVSKKETDKISILLWSIFGVLLLVQLLAAAFMVCGDGDDAYYVAVSTVAESSDKMYRVLPYTGGPTSLDYRHALAPFPIFIAFLSRVTGVHTAALSHVAIQLFFIPATYCIYGMIGDRLLKGKKRELAVFMIFAALVILWGNTSVYTAETFLLTRTRQGKAALANFAIPALVLFMYMLAERLSEKKKVEKALWVAVFAGVTSACFFSTFGGFLTALFLGVTGFCMIVVYKNLKLIFPFCISVLPAVVYSVLYIVLE